MRVPRSVQVVIVRETFHGREVLALRRVPNRGGFWQPVTGRVEPGESFAETARREVSEELGLTVAPDEIHDLGYCHSYALKREWLVNYPPGTTHNDEAAFAIFIGPETEIRTDPGEHDAHEWLSPEAATKRFGWHGNREALRRALDLRNVRPGRFDWRCGLRRLELGKTARVMGILNVTPDSFSDGGRYDRLDSATMQAERMLAEGADLIDIGGESTRPGASVISVKEEIDRVVPIIERLRLLTDRPLSIDTYKAEVARAAIEAGADIVNDISGLRFDPELANVVARNGVGLVLMHSRGEPGSLHGLPPVDDIFEEVETGFRRSLSAALDAGVAPECIVLDPGIGFGKTVNDNIALLGGFHRFGAIGFPLLVGASRKSFLGAMTGRHNPDDRLFATAASTVIAVERGAHVLRVHDVAAACDCVAVAEAVACGIPGR